MLIAAIPEKYREGFKKIASMSDIEFEAIKSNLELTSLAASIRILSNKVSELKGVDSQTVERIFFSTGSLINLVDNGVTDFNTVAEDITELGVKSSLFNEDKRDIFKERLSFLLQNSQIYYAAKAQDLITENSNVFLTSRVITDIRPIFDMNLKSEPKCGVIIHNLHIHYRKDEEGDHKDIFISLDSNDIQSLKEDILRAEQKENNLKLIFEKSGMINLNE